MLFLREPDVFGPRADPWLYVGTYRPLHSIQRVVGIGRISFKGARRLLLLDRGSQTSTEKTPDTVCFHDEAGCQAEATLRPTSGHSPRKGERANGEVGHTKERPRLKHQRNPSQRQERSEQGAAKKKAKKDSQQGPEEPEEPPKKKAKPPKKKGKKKADATSDDASEWTSSDPESDE